MKDRQGVMRGKCNVCDECEEYVAPKEGARCEYCDHTPVAHVKIIKLGGCKNCGEDCTEYISGKENSYTDCDYCGCKATEHQGAEKLRKPKPKTDQQQPPVYSPSSGSQPQSFSSPTHASLPASAADVCRNIGCSRPRYVENGRKHDFCGRTCAKKFAENQGKQGAPSLTSVPTFGGISGFAKCTNCGAQAIAGTQYCKFCSSTDDS